MPEVDKGATNTDPNWDKKINVPTNIYDSEIVSRSYIPYIPMMKQYSNDEVLLQRDHHLNKRLKEMKKRTVNEKEELQESKKSLINRTQLKKQMKAIVKRYKQKHNIGEVHHFMKVLLKSLSSKKIAEIKNNKVNKTEDIKTTQKSRRKNRNEDHTVTQKKKNRYRKINIATSKSKVAKVETRTGKGRFSVEEHQLNMKKDKANVENGKSNVEKDKPNIKKDKVNVENGKSNVEKDKPNIKKSKSDVENGKSNVEKDKSNVEKDKSDIINDNPDVANGSLLINTEENKEKYFTGVEQLKNVSMVSTFGKQTEKHSNLITKGTSATKRTEINNNSEFMMDNFTDVSKKKSELMMDNFNFENSMQAIEHNKEAFTAMDSAMDNPRNSSAETGAKRTELMIGNLLIDPKHESNINLFDDNDMSKEGIQSNIPNLQEESLTESMEGNIMYANSPKFQEIKSTKEKEKQVTSV